LAFFHYLVLVRAIPGDPCRAMIGEKATQASCGAFQVRYGLNDSDRAVWPLCRKSAQGDFGNSIETQCPVSLILLERLPSTLERPWPP
jgi:ABC-type dipeptide/oligopeptide/nickel transport system permease component